MRNNEVIIVDYGVGNISSVSSALLAVGARPTVTSDIDRINDAQRLILPGVGAFRAARQRLEERGLVEALSTVRERSCAVLGICLGMQLLFDRSHEFGLTEGLSIIPGDVDAIPDKDDAGMSLRVPSIGWHPLVRPEHVDGDHYEKLTHGIDADASFYFVHSYHGVAAARGNTLARYVFGGHDLTAVAGIEGVTGCQFHPEKSGPNGLQIIRNFVENFRG